MYSMYSTLYAARGGGGRGGLELEQMFFSAISKTLNWEILTKNLVTFKRLDGVKDMGGEGRGCG